MSCERHTSVILDHACGAEIAADAAVHLRDCAACRRMFEEQRRLLQGLDEQLALALAIEPSARFVPEVMARVEGSAVRRRRAMWWSIPAAAAVVLMLVTFGSLRFGGRPATERPDRAVQSAVTSAPIADRAPSTAAKSSGAGEGARLTDARRRVDRPRGVVERPRRIDADVLVEADQSRAIARYLALVRRGALDTSAIVSADVTGVATPTDLVIVPLSVDPLAVTDVENGVGPGVDRREPGFR